MENQQKELARKIIETTDTNLFLTGRAGTGKTTFLRQLRDESPKRMVVLAPTGIAAINAQGSTIHSFFQLSFGPYVPGVKVQEQRNYRMNKDKIKLIQSLDLLVIDEISMVRADLLDAVDDALRRYRHNTCPFGGVQLLLIGDLQQLTPVVKEEEWTLLSAYYDTPYFFSSQALRQTDYVTVELEKIYRQSDTHFLTLLNNVREAKATDQTLSELNKRYLPNFAPRKEEGYIRLVTHNWQAQQVNSHELEQLPSPTFTYEAKIAGRFSDQAYPTDPILTLKQGAQVMFVKNDTNKNYFNGMIGEVVEINDHGFSVRPNTAPDKIIYVQPEEWQNTRYALDPQTKEIKEEVEGTFTQYPIKLAWAITIHKSQGLTFERVMIDASGAFAHGQTYVALSRCKTLEGIILTTPIPPSAIITDEALNAFTAEMQRRTVSPERLTTLRKAYSANLLTQLFTFDKERILLSSYTRLLQEHLTSLYAQTARSFEAALHKFDLSVMNVSSRFHQQYASLLAANDGQLTDDHLQDRIQRGANYFIDCLYEVRDLLQAIHLDIDNAQLSKRENAARADALAQFKLHIKLLEATSEAGFSVSQFLRTKARLLLEANESTVPKGKARTSRSPHAEQHKFTVPDEVTNPTLYYRLKEWRLKRASELHLPPYTVLNTKAMMTLANFAPTHPDQLKRIPYFGARSIEKYGSDLLQLIAQYLDDKRQGRVEEASVEPVKPIIYPGETTFDATLRLFKEDRMTIDQIAHLRELTPSTILTHLSRFIPTGQVSLTDLVTPEAYDRIKAYFSQHGNLLTCPLSEARAAIGDDLSYGEIRLVMDHLGVKNA